MKMKNFTQKVVLLEVLISGLVCLTSAAMATAQIPVSQSPIAAQTSTPNNQFTVRASVPSFADRAAVENWTKGVKFVDYLKLEIRPEVQNLDKSHLPSGYLTNDCTAKQLAKFVALLEVYKRFAADRLGVVCYAGKTTELLLANDSLILVSSKDFGEWSDDKIRAAVAHELFHSAFYLEYNGYRLKSDFAGLQSIELRCDALAVQLMKEVGINPKNLTKVLKKQEQFVKNLNLSQEELQTHPNFATRYRLIEDLSKQ